MGGQSTGIGIACIAFRSLRRASAPELVLSGEGNDCWLLLAGDVGARPWHFPGAICVVFGAAALCEADESPRRSVSCRA